MADDFKYDVFLSYSLKDKAVVRAVAERLRADGLRVWFDEWEFRFLDSKATKATKFEEGLEHSRVLVLCLSAHAFGSDWAQMEAGTFRFRDPLNTERRFILLRLDETPIQGGLAQFSYINWLPEDREQEYAKLLEACRPPVKQSTTEAEAAREQVAEKVVQLHNKAGTWSNALSTDGTRVLTGDNSNTVCLWDLESGQCLRVLKGHSGGIRCVAWSADHGHILSGSEDNTVRIWDLESGHCLQQLDHRIRVMIVAVSSDNRRILSGGHSMTIWQYNPQTGCYVREVEWESLGFVCAAWGADSRHFLLGHWNKTVELWDIETRHRLRVFEGHTDNVRTVAWSVDQRRALSGSADNTVRLWDVETGRCLRVLEGHTGRVSSALWSSDR